MLIKTPNAILEITPKLQDETHINYEDDCKTIVKICKEHGVTLSLIEANTFWYEISDNLDACWLSVNDKEYVWQYFYEFISKMCDIHFLMLDYDDED